MDKIESNTEEKIFNAATEVFIIKGFDGARMQDIADFAGINTAALHYYYRSKKRLFDAVFEKIANQILSRLVFVLDENLTLEEKIKYFFREHISFLQNNPTLPTFVVNELNRNPEKIKKFIQKINLKELGSKLENQHKEELENYNITKETIPMLIVSIAALCVFPFVDRVLIESVMKEIGYNFDDYMVKRKEHLSDFVIKAILK